jgi:hypothetical protein
MYIKIFEFNEQDVWEHDIPKIKDTFTIDTDKLVQFAKTNPYEFEHIKPLSEYILNNRDIYEVPLRNSIGAHPDWFSKFIVDDPKVSIVTEYAYVVCG